MLGWEVHDPYLIDEVFDILGPGDIVTHCFNGKRAGSISDTPALFRQARELAQAGVIMDIGHGQASFSFETARRAVSEGFLPDTISTDLHLRNVNGPVHDLALTASKLLAVGLDFDACIGAITTRPREVLGLPCAAAPGMRADFTVFDMVESDEVATDSEGAKLALNRMLEPHLTVLGHSVQQAGRRLP